VRGTGLVAAAAAVLLVGCASSTPVFEVVPQTGAWPHIEYPEGSGITAALRLNQIIEWTHANPSPLADQARELAEACGRDHHRVGALHSQEVLRAWNHAHSVATQPGLPPHEKDQLWQRCVDELTHGP